MDFDEIISQLEFLAFENDKKNLKRFGINCINSYGIKLPELRKIAKNCGKDHELAQKLWEHGYHETFLLATLIEEADKVTENQLNQWVNTFYSWDLVDQACINLLRFIPQARENIFVWCNAEDEFVKRTAFSLIAVLAVHEKDTDFEIYFPILAEGSKDNRNFVKKSVNWAIRQIGKTNLKNNKKALKLSYEILQNDNNTSKWVARGAIKELESEKVLSKLGGKQ